MKLLADILYKVRIKQLQGSTNVAIESVVFDSREVVSYSLFIAVKGTQVNGHDFIQTAIENGAVAIICEKLPDNLEKGVTYILVDNSPHALSHIAANYYDNPSSHLKLVGITGTNGKTSTATLLFNLFRALGHKTGLISTVENRINSEVIPSTHTTPDALQLNSLLRKMVNTGCRFCFMEVSSHALHQQRVLGIAFAGAVFTNLTHDHLDYHNTFNDYIAAKKLLFDNLGEETFALVNSDDKQGDTMLQNTKAKKYTYAIKRMADFRAKIVENQFTGLQLHINDQDLYTRLIGGFNAYNILAVYGTAVLLGQPELYVLTALSGIKTAEGRFQHVKTPGGVTAIVDYAHTPDALLNVLKTISDIRTRNEKVITVVGCGGNRDKSKRPEMARIACNFSDKVVLTSDNPRNEDPAVIIEDMQAGVEPQDFKKTVAIENRREAIKMACSMAGPGDIILIAGKGHEKYQDIKGVKHPFDDVEVLNETLKLLEK